MNGKRTDRQAQQASEREILEGVSRHLAGVEVLVPDAPAWHANSSSSHVGGRVHIRSRMQFALAPVVLVVVLVGLVIAGGFRQSGPGGPTARPSAAQPTERILSAPTGGSCPSDASAGVVLDLGMSCLEPEVGAVTRSGSGMVGVILPDATTSARYTSYDPPYLAQAFKTAGYADSQFRIDNAPDSSSQISIAQADIHDGAKVLVVDPIDVQAGRQIQSLAAAAGVSLIAYDRPVFAGTSTYYVSFDNVQVGKLIGQGLMNCVADWKVANPKVFELDGGEDTDPSAISVAAGYNNVLWGTDLGNASTLPAGTTGSAGYTLVGDQYAPAWMPDKAGSIFSEALTAHPEINVTVEANDGLANAVIQVLKARGVSPKTVPTTGQDATLQGLANILQGWQCGTVYKPIYLEAEATVVVATYLRAGHEPPIALINGMATDPTSAAAEPAVLLAPLWVNAANMESTVIKDGLVSATDLCAAVGASLCTQYGIK
jgi:D-xylose transport system substrate-binding protein